tara:strand:+ start:341 stop:523 length:183 start_codon:yes stop_codon:yes gene_type:complete
MLKKDYENMTNCIVEYILKFEDSCTGYVPTQKAKEQIVNDIKRILENSGVEIETKRKWHE